MDAAQARAAASGVEVKGVRRGIYRRVQWTRIHGDAMAVLRAGDFVGATLTLECGHEREWELQCCDDEGRVYAFRRPPHGLWCRQCPGRTT